MVLRNEAIKTKGLLPGFEEETKRTYEVYDDESPQEMGVASNSNTNFDDENSESVLMSTP